MKISQIIKDDINEIFSKYTDYQIYNELIQFDKQQRNYTLLQIIYMMKNLLAKNTSSGSLNVDEQRIVNNFRNLQFVILRKEEILKYNNDSMRTVIYSLFDDINIDELP